MTRELHRHRLALLVLRLPNIMNPMSNYLALTSSEAWFHSKWDKPDLLTKILSFSSPLDEELGNNLSEGEFTAATEISMIFK